jgi:integrase
LLVATGARIGTVVLVRGVDIDLQKGVVRLQNRKVKRGYNAYLSGEVSKRSRRALRRNRPRLNQASRYNARYQIFSTKKQIRVRKSYIANKAAI